MRDTINGSQTWTPMSDGDADCCAGVAPQPAYVRRPEDFRSEALAQAMDLHRGRGEDAEDVVRAAAKFEAYLAAGAAGVQLVPKRVIHRMRDGTLRVDIFKD